MPPPEFFTGDLHNWVNSSGKMIQIYDPSTTTLHERHLRQRRRFPTIRFRSRNSILLRKRLWPTYSRYVKPNVPSLVPGTSAYVRNNAISTRHRPEAEQQVEYQGRPGDHLEAENSHSCSAARGNRIWVAATRPSTLPFPLSGNPGYNRADVYRLSYDYTISPTLLNRFYAGGNNWRQNHGSYTTVFRRARGRRNSHHIDGLEKQGDLHTQLAQLQDRLSHQSTFPTFNTWGVGAPNGSDNIVVEFRDDMTKVHGSHTFKWGYYYNNTHYNGFGSDEHCRERDLLLSQHRDSARHQPGNRKRFRVVPAGPGVRL